ncbi:Cof-type HAD-IIB family hydrolase [Mycoplasma bradburyae]|uniref:HAD family hydrolase n=1 Tax=Mycoplasma bradburyae TaxID=2963128 RepID=A0AAW6HNZ8_9MOLU|nr:Cof-type HAD-IIB family hydrolase [Mycoplasma bradburyae]MDC4162975.1 HAD family hydrolase [Mycoplasma bradburyae]MDC4181586.1 HAD family hydrolase [Mycoplasma bradburyae]MDC4182312.1 HAD family hydrolase [Mycoplasma bradburyae]MDC4183039.1 HAD family hydrolase [Mycoplasma bradburyae]MDC4183757.1 HAD family hydrolase [Mycoplasma bradburyae]
MKNNIEWVISDLDGTLIRYENNEHIVDPEAIRAIEKLPGKNISFTIATGRKQSDVVNLLKKYDLSSQTRYIIACNGAIIYDLVEDKIIKNNYLTKKVKTTVMEFMDEFKNITDDCLVLSYDLNNNIYVYDKNKKHNKKLIEELTAYEGSFTDNNYIETDDLNAHDDLIKLIFFYGKKAIKEDITEYLAKFLNLTKLEASDCVIVSPMAFELNSENTSKGNAILELNKILKKDLKNTLSIGDSFNDISMFKVTGLSVTLESSHKEVQNNATNILDVKASQVVADAIELFVL